MRGTKQTKEYAIQLSEFLYIVRDSYSQSIGCKCYISFHGQHIGRETLKTSF